MLNHYTIRFESGTIIEFDEDDILQATLTVRHYRREHHEYTPAHIMIDPILDHNGKHLEKLPGNRLFIRRMANA